MTINYQSVRFPNEEVFIQLLKAANTCQHAAVIDFNHGITATYTSLLTDVIQTRQNIWSQIPGSVFDEKGLITPDTPYIFILAPASYSFVIASFSILSIGAALCTMCKSNNSPKSQTSSGTDTRVNFKRPKRRNPKPSCHCRKQSPPSSWQILYTLNKP